MKIAYRSLGSSVKPRLGNSSKSASLELLAPGVDCSRLRKSPACSGLTSAVVGCCWLLLWAQEGLVNPHKYSWKLQGLFALEFHECPLPGRNVSFRGNCYRACMCLWLLTSFECLLYASDIMWSLLHPVITTHDHFSLWDGGVESLVKSDWPTTGKSRADFTALRTYMFLDINPLWTLRLVRGMNEVATP